ncbi:MAG: ATP-binding protein [Alphaproteobacteria bacterium]
MAIKSKKQNKLGIFFIKLLDSKWRNWITNTVIILGIISGFITLYLLSSDIDGNKSGLVEFFVQLDMFFLAIIVLFLFYRISRLALSSYRGESGSGLQRRFAFLFSLITLLPAIVIAVFSIVFFDLGMKTWFSDRVSSALQESRKVATAYLKEHQNTIIGDVQTIARDIDSRYQNFEMHEKELEQNLAMLGVLTNLTEILVFDTMGRVYGRYGLTASLEMEPISFDAIARAKEGKVVVLKQDNSRRVRAIAKLNRFKDTYVIVGRFVDHKVISSIQNTKLAISQYEALELNRSSLKVSFTLVFVLIVLLLLATSIWVGLSLASILTNPVRHLIKATDDVSRGRLKTRVDASIGYDELSELMKSFNKMTSDLDASSKSLKKANRDIIENSQFIETLLQGLSTGIVALSPKGRVLLTNDSANKMLALKEDYKNKEFVKIFPEFAEVVSRTIKSKRNNQAQIEIGSGIHKKNYLVKVGVEKHNKSVLGIIVAFEDITELEKAQKNKAWSDVARRVAHEIKNPLTPIQLSAERLTRRYKDKIDDEIFENCTDTIIKQVGEIGRLVDEFNSFARMPVPVMVEANLADTVKKSFSLQKTAHNFIKYKMKSPTNIKYKHDVHQIGQMVTNVMKNAFVELSNANHPNGQILVNLEVGKKDIILRIEDNGKGFPEKGRDKLFEPYITNSDGGTGLGLSIVKKVVEDHKGTITLSDSKALGGAMVEIKFKV